MGTHLTLTASDDHKFDAYRVDPAGTPKGGIVVIQELFGVNRHIRSVADRFAALGYVAIAPALFDRIEAGFDKRQSEAPFERYWKNQLDRIKERAEANMNRIRETNQKPPEV